MPRFAESQEPGPTVLVVDDDPVVRANAVHLFQDLGFRVFDAYSGPEGLRLIGAHPEIDLLFVDVRMPGMNGIEVADAAKRVRPTINVVFTSGYVDSDMLPSGALFVPKPWRVDQIVDAIAGVATG